MKICYKETKFKDKSLYLIEKVNTIVEDYDEQGYSLTLRQLYYQLVARDIIPNNQKSYDNLGALVNNARLSGLVDWHAIEDRTRNIRNNFKWQDPRRLLKNAAEQFDLDKWEDQDEYVEIWVEKDALIGIVGQAAEIYDVPYFSCRGYVSQSEMWNAAQRIINKLQKHEHATIIHLGDHDPSGKDMTRDIDERIDMFLGEHGFSKLDFEIQRVALEMEQIYKYNPPPNPAKLTDSRCKKYISDYGYKSWELDALEPRVLTDIITKAVREHLDIDLYNEYRQKEERIKAELKQYAQNFKY